MAATALAFAAAACGDTASDDAPVLLALQSTGVAVNNTLRLALLVENPVGVGLELSVQGPSLPGFDQVTQLGGAPGGGEFQWTPLASHVGTHELTFSITSNLGGNSQSVLIEVTAPDSAAPIFLRPGAGGTYDLGSDPCVTVDIEVRDDDSASVDIRARSEPPAGAVVVATGAKQAQFQWCPDQGQIAQSERWTLELDADDGDHLPTEHDFLVVLRTVTRENCPGTPPSIAVDSPGQGARVESASSYTIEVTVTDDTGIRDAPLLYYSTVAPETPADLDITSFDQVTFTGSRSDWSAEIPPIELLEGEERTVYYLVSVTDNDDENGTACDHRVETSLRSFDAVGASEELRAGLCEACNASLRCETGLCAVFGGGGRCLTHCRRGDVCDGFSTCGDVNTSEGVAATACGDVVAACEGGGPSECVDDGFEDNDSFDDARYVDFSPVEATLCGGDDDFYEIDAIDDTEIEIILDQFEHINTDLDLALLDNHGERIRISAGIADTERVEYCLPGGDHAVVRVYGFRANASSDYRLRIQESDGNCCIDDSDEPDDTLDDARPVDIDGTLEGTICPGNEDNVYFDIEEPSHLSALLVFTHAEADLDFELYAPDNRRIALSWSASDDESIEHDLADTGRYTLRIFPFDEGSTDYLGEIALEALAGGQNGEACESFDDCIGERACIDWPEGYCARSGCTSDADCEGDTFCSDHCQVGGVVVPVCVKRCGTGEPACREDYSCELVFDLDFDLYSACVPYSCLMDF
jgi:hypothetical protein